MPVRPIPDNTSTVIPYLVVSNAGRLIDFLKQAFDAKEMHRSSMPDGSVMHAHVRIGDSSVMLGQAPAGKSPMVSMLYVYVTDVDAVYRRALDAGASAMAPVADQFYGDRAGSLKDPAGNEWWIATHKQDLSEEELARRAKAAKQKR